MESKKAKHDRMKTHLNHLIITMGLIGGGSFTALQIGGKMEVMGWIGFIVIVISTKLYAIITSKMEEIEKDMK